jgi:hypothetical protein
VSKALTVSGAFLCAVLVSATVDAGPILSEGFDNISLLPGAGWVTINNSSPIGTTGWFQGNSGVFGSQSGAASSYIAANFNNADFGGNVSNWLLTPVVSLASGNTLSFWVQDDAVFLGDTLEVRYSTAGSSANVGSTDASVGDFSNLLQTIVWSVNPGWMNVSVALPTLAPGATGRLAFRYVIQDTSLNGDYLGIDNLTYGAAVPEPATLALLGTGLAGLVVRRRRSR